MLWRSVLLVEETGVPRENPRPVASHSQTLSHNVISSTPRQSGIRTHNCVVIATDCISSKKSNYHTITTSPQMIRKRNQILKGACIAELPHYYNILLKHFQIMLLRVPCKSMTLYGNHVENPNSTLEKCFLIDVFIDFAQSMGY